MHFFKKRALVFGQFQVFRLVTKHMSKTMCNTYIAVKMYKYWTWNLCKLSRRTTQSRLFLACVNILILHWSVWIMWRVLKALCQEFCVIKVAACRCVSMLESAVKTFCLKSWLIYIFDEKGGRNIKLGR